MPVSFNFGPSPTGTGGSFPFPLPPPTRGGFGDVVGDVLRQGVALIPSVVGNLINSRAQKDVIREQRKLLQASTAFGGGFRPTTAFSPAINTGTPRGEFTIPQVDFGGDMGSPFASNLVGRIPPAVARAGRDILGGIAGGAAVGALDGMGGGGGNGAFNGVATQPFTPKGNPTKLFMTTAPNGRVVFFANAGMPKTWSRINFKKPRRCPRPR